MKGHVAASARDHRGFRYHAGYPPWPRARRPERARAAPYLGRAFDGT